jgi:hypothetical protein
MALIAVPALRHVDHGSVVWTNCVTQADQSFKTGARFTVIPVDATAFDFVPGASLCVDVDLRFLDGGVLWSGCAVFESGERFGERCFTVECFMEAGSSMWACFVALRVVTILCWLLIRPGI